MSDGVEASLLCMIYLNQDTADIKATTLRNKSQNSDINVRREKNVLRQEVIVSSWTLSFIEGTLKNLNSVRNRHNNVVEQEQSWITIFTRIHFSRSNGLSHCIPLGKLGQNLAFLKFFKIQHASVCTFSFTGFGSG